MCVTLAIFTHFTFKMNFNKRPKIWKNLWYFAFLATFAATYILVSYHGWRFYIVGGDFSTPTLQPTIDYTGSVAQYRQSIESLYNVELSEWNRIRLGSLWVAQDLSPSDTEGGMRDYQAVMMLHRLDEARAFGRRIKHICEVGFWRGGSSLFWLLNVPGSVVHSFDSHINRPGAVEWFKTHYPGRWELTVGDSLKTIPKFASEHPGWCDLIFIDGNHRDYGPYLDVVNFKPAAHDKTIIVADDTFDTIHTEPESPSKDFLQSDMPSKCWQRALNEGIIRPSRMFEKMCDVLGGYSVFLLGHCWGEYVK